MPIGLIGADRDPHGVSQDLGKGRAGILDVRALTGEHRSNAGKLGMELSHDHGGSRIHVGLDERSSIGTEGILGYD